MDGLRFNGRFMTEEGKKRFLRDWKNKNNELVKIVDKGNNNLIKITLLGNGDIVTFAKELEDAKDAISEAILVKKIASEKFGR
jgi:hypothetical protein